MLHHVPSPELQDQLFAEAARVLLPVLVCRVDSVENEWLRDFHQGDTYQPVDPVSLPERLDAAGFCDVEVRTGDYGLIALARRA